MTATVHTFTQGSEAWNQFRAEHYGASEAAAMLGISKYTTRAELLRLKATGITPEVSPQLQAVFDRGHETEIGGRKMAEAIIGEELFPATYSEGKLSVSCDGLTMLGDIAFEHKQHNAALADAVRAGNLPAEHQPQCQQVMMVTGAERLLFMVSDGTPEQCVHVWVEPDTEWRNNIVQGWTQFSIDLEAYQHVETTPAPVADTIEALPALFVQVEGKVLATNLDAFKVAAQTFIDGIKTELVNDQDFADADKMVKFLKDGEDRLALAKQQALAQTASIDELFRTVDAISEQMRGKRLVLSKLVASEKENRKAAIVTSAHNAIKDHVAKLNTRIGGNWMPTFSVQPFADAVKGLKSLDSMRDKVDGEIASAKIAANEIADTIEANRKSLMIGTENDASHLFPDFAAVCTKAIDDFTALHAMRIQQSARAYSGAAITPAIQQSDMGLSLDGTAGKSVLADRIADTSKTIDESIIDDFIRLLPVSAPAKKAMRETLQKWEKYRVARAMQEAA